MRTRTPKSATPKRTPAGRKTALATKTAPPDPVAEPDTPTTAETTHGSSASKSEQVVNNEETVAAASTPVMVLEPKADELTEGKASEDKNLVAAERKTATPRKRVVKKVVRVVKRVTGKARTPASVKGAPKMEEEDKVEESAEEEGSDMKKAIEVMEKESVEIDNAGELTARKQAGEEVKEASVETAEGSAGKVKFVIDLEQPAVQSPEEQAGIAVEDGKNVMELEEPAGEFVKDDFIETVGQPVDKEKVVMEVDAAPNKEVCEELKEDTGKGVCDMEAHKIDSVKVADVSKGKSVGDDAQLEQRSNHGGDSNYEDYGERVDFEDHGEDDFIEEDPEEDPEEPTEEAEALEEERRELAAVAEECKLKKEYEIFVGGLDRDATEEDVKRVFENIGEVVEVRLHKNLSTNRNKGYAFVKFANKEHVRRALSEMRNPVICGKRCGVAPSEDNDTLFLGNICNTWTKEAIRQKLKDYGVEGVENITLVPDVQHEGRSRGFAFIEFSCHADAMLAYKRLQKHDVVFGHAERTAKVAFAEPIREPDPEVMAKVKTVFLDGLPSHWDEDQVRQCLKGHGEIVRIVLARNMSTAKRRDFGFVDFSTHDAAVACIDSINNTEMGDGMSKTRVRARLSNPLPKTQAVKGGMCGGFRIGRAGSGTFPRFGRGFAQGGRNFNWPNFQRGRGFYQRGHSQSYRTGSQEFGHDNRYLAFRGRQNVGRGGRRGNFRGGYHPAGTGVAAVGPSRFNYDRIWFDAPDRVPRDHVSSRRPPFLPEEGFDGPFSGRHFDDPYYYEDGTHGLKRPFYMTDHDHEYPEPSRIRPRLDYADPASSVHGTRYRDTYGGGSDPYSRDYYGYDYGGYPPYHGSDRSYGRGYYY